MVEGRKRAFGINAHVVLNWHEGKINPRGWMVVLVG